MLSFCSVHSQAFILKLCTTTRSILPLTSADDHAQRSQQRPRLWRAASAAAAALAIFLGLSSTAAAAESSHDLLQVAQNLGNKNTVTSPQDPVKVCAVPQLYAALSTLQKHSKIAFVPYFATSGELYALLSNTKLEQLPQLCDLLLSSDERLPISLVRTNRALASSLIPFTRAPLVLWSANKDLLQGHDPNALIRAHKIKSLALAKSSLTPVGFASRQVLEKHLASNEIKDHIYRTEHEYQVYSMVASGNVDCGLISMPLIFDDKQKTTGSYWLAPRRTHSDIQYYGVLLSPSVHKRNAQELLRALVEDEKIQAHLSAFGFAPLKSSI